MEKSVRKIKTERKEGMKLEAKINAESRIFYTVVTHFDTECSCGFFSIYI